MKLKGIIFTTIAAIALGVGNSRGATNEVSGLLQKGLFEEEANRNLDAAIRAYEAVIAQTDKDRQFAATAIFRLGECYRKQGKISEANAQYQRILREFADQKELVTLSRQQLGGAADQGQAGTTPVRSETQENPASAGYAEVEQIRQLQTMLRDSPDLLNIRVDTSGSSRLHEAVRNGQLKVAKFLLDNQADVNARDGFMATPLQTAASQGRKDMVELLLSRGAKVDAQDRDGKSALHSAAERGYKAIAELLIAHGAPVDARLKDGETPLHEAAHSGNTAVAELLLANKADVNAKDVNGGTPLFIAAEMGQTPVVELLIANHADLNAQRKGLTPFMKAIAQGHTDTAKVILQHGADIKLQMPEDSRDWPGWAALEFAVDKNNLEMTSLLLEKGANVNLKVQQGFTPLIAAVNNRSLAIAKLLVEHGAEVNSQMYDNHPNTPRWTALDAAVSVNSDELVKFLLEHRADPNLNFDLRNTDSRNTTPLMMATWNRQKENVKTLLENKADPNLKDGKGATALWQAFQISDLEITALLLDSKADTEIKYSQGRTVLLWAVAAGKTNFAEVFLAHGARTDAQDDAGQTALHLAVANNSKGMVELLLAHGADVNAKDKQGDTPLDLKAKSGGARPVMLNPYTGQATGSAPFVYQWSVNGEPEAGTTDEIDTLLRQHGGVAEEDVATIRVMRNGKVSPTIIFRKDAAGYNHYKLFETILQAYGPLSVGNSHWNQSWGGQTLKFPDFSKLKIYHLRESGRTNLETVDLQKAASQGDCSENISLKWGDVVDVPEMDHKVSQDYNDLPQTVRNLMGTCLVRTVSIKVKGQTTWVRLAPDETDFPLDQTNGVTLKMHGFWLKNVVFGANVVLASSDLTRVAVKRGSAKAMIVDAEKEKEPGGDLWLEDGDVIEIPEKNSE